MNAIRSISANAVATVQETLSPQKIAANMTAGKVMKIAAVTLALTAMANIPGADAGPIAAWTSFAGCIAMTWWCPLFTLGCPEVALAALILPTP